MVIAKYLVRRLLYTIPTLLAITVIIFAVLRVIPGDILTAFYGQDDVTRLTETQRQAIMEALGLSDPYYIQYLRWLGDIATLEFGRSFFRTYTVAEVIAHRGPITLEIAIGATIVSWLVGFPAGIISGLKRNSIGDYLSRFLTILFLAVPGFWVGMLLVLWLVLTFGYKSPIEIIQIWENPWQNLQIIWGPALVLGISSAAYIARMTRSSLLEIMGQEYIRTARAKGLAERVTLLRHAVRNAILPVLTISGILLSFLIGGSVAIEQVFGVKGMGEILIRAISERDVVTIQNLVLLYGIIFTVMNIIIDLMYAWLDPRIRYS